MSTEKARRWTLKGYLDSEYEPHTVIKDGPSLAPNKEEEIEVAEVSALRAEWEEELLRKVVEKTASPAGVALTDGYQRGRSDERQAWIAAIKEERDRG